MTDEYYHLFTTRKIHKTIKAGVLPSVVPRFGKVFDLSSESFTSIRANIGRRKARVKSKYNVQRLVDTLVD